MANAVSLIRTGESADGGRRLLVVAHRDERAPDPAAADLDDEVTTTDEHDEADDVVGALRRQVDRPDRRPGA